MKVGDRLWYFDENRRAYTKLTRAEKAAGKLWSEPIWIKSWRPITIVGETRVSWLFEFPSMKLPKHLFLDGECPPDWCFTFVDVKRKAWVHDHRVVIHHAVGRLAAGAVLDHVALTIGLLGRVDASPFTSRQRGRARGVTRGDVLHEILYCKDFNTLRSIATLLGIP